MYELYKEVNVKSTGTMLIITTRFMDTITCYCNHW